MKKTIAILLVAVLAFTLFAGCGKTDSEKDAVLSGKYVDKDNNSYEFLEDGKCIMGVMGITSVDVTYSVNGNEVTIQLEYGSYKGKIDGNKITILEAGEDVVYEKQS